MSEMDKGSAMRGHDVLPGSDVPKPNLFVIGASKCGTTFMHDLLRQHPEIFMTQPKEPFYFNRDDRADGIDDYLSLFSGSERYRLRGESSPTYCETLAFPHIPSEIHNISPDAKIIFLVREPFSRFKSVWTQTLSTGHWSKPKFYPMKMPLAYREAVFTYPTFLYACRYWTNLNNYRAYFSDDNIKVILFEHFVADVEGTMREVFRFLGVDPHVRIDTQTTERNSSKGKTVDSPLCKRLTHLAPVSVKNILPQGLRRKLWSYLTKLSTPKFDHSELSLEDVTSIRTQLAPEVRVLYAYMGIEDDPWFFLREDELRQGPVPNAPFSSKSAEV